jgi:uncharacterized protein YkwD
MPYFGSISIRRAVPAALVAGMLLSTLPAATMGASASGEVKAAERSVLNHMNQFRRGHGLAPLRMAGRVRLVARDRSRSMKNLDYFSHVSPSGATAGSMLRSRSVTHAFWGEAIGWTSAMGLETGARWMVNWWKGSTTHRRLMLRQDFNYAGVGVAREGGKTLWTIVFVNQPDHTPPFAQLMGPSSRTIATSSSSVTVCWSGQDRRLSTRTAGLRAFILQHKRSGGDWTVMRRTTSRQATMSLSRGQHYFRLRAVDRRGNRGGWQKPLKVVIS